MNLITHINFAKGFRGGERQTLLLVKELSKKGFSQKILTRKDSELANRLVNVKNLEVIRVNKPYVINLKKVKDSKLIHAHETKAAQFAYFAFLRYKIPYLVTRRVDIDIKNNFFNRNIYLNSFTTVVLSSAIRERVIKLNKNISTKVIPSCYTKFSYDSKKIEKIKERFTGKFLIGNIGALEYSKGQDIIIDIARDFEQKYPEIHFILLGTGKNEEQFKDKARNLKNITFEGFVNNVGDYIKNLDLFIFPTLSEGLGSILLDVINEKVPIIASDVGGIPDIIENNKTGVLIEPSNKEKLMLSIEELYLDKEKSEFFVKNGFKNIEKFNLENMTNSYEEIYKRFLI